MCIEYAIDRMNSECLYIIVANIGWKNVCYVIEKSIVTKINLQNIIALLVHQYTYRRSYIIDTQFKI
jgi:hypothetical protein